MKATFHREAFLATWLYCRFCNLAQRSGSAFPYITWVLVPKLRSITYLYINYTLALERIFNLLIDLTCSKNKRGRQHGTTLRFFKYYPPLIFARSFFWSWESGMRTKKNRYFKLCILFILNQGRTNGVRAPSGNSPKRPHSPHHKGPLHRPFPKPLINYFLSVTT